ANALADHLAVDRCAYAEVEDQRVFVITGEARRGDASSILGRWDVAAFGDGCARAMRAGEPWIVTDATTDPRLTTGDREAYAATQIVAVVCVPLHKAGRFTAAMAVHQRAPRTWTPAECEIVGIVAARCWEALERMRIARTLQESEARHRAMIEASPEAVTLTTRNGTILQINPAGLGFVQTQPPTELQGENFYAFVAPGDRARFQAFNERVCDGQGGQIQYDVIGQRGTRRTLVTTGVPLPLPSGGHAHLGMTRDISARVAANRALEESRARLDYAVRLSGIGFWYCDLPFDELIWDAKVKAHFFFGPEERVAIDDFYARLHPDDREATRRAIDESIGDHQPYDIVYRTVDPRRGEVHWVHALGGAAYAPDGSPTRFDGVTLDVTEQRLDRERLALLNEQLREQDRRKDEFLATLAHELRNPLAPIRTGVEILRSDRASPDQSLRVHEMMDRQLGHLVRMLDDLLDISRVTLGKVSLRRAPVDFRTVLHSALETARPLVDAGGHELSVRIGPGPYPLHGDATRLAQVISNLLNNAARYTPPAGHIGVAAEVDGAMLVVRITDDGPGIPTDMLTRVFDLFTQLRPGATPSQGGLGLGLTLVRRLVEMHGGSVSAASEGPGRVAVERVGSGPDADAERVAPRVDERPRGLERAVQ
ncbi:PAS domain S-box protein, partial [bacterium]